MTRPRRSLAYETLNRPWRARILIRAVRFGYRRQHERDIDHMAWAMRVRREMDEQRRRERVKKIFDAYAAVGADLQLWQAEMIHDLMTRDSDAAYLFSAPRQYGASSFITRAAVANAKEPR